MISTEDQPRAANFFARSAVLGSFTATSSTTISLPSAALADSAVLRPSLRIFLFRRSEEHTSELQSLMRISYAVFCLKKKKTKPSTSKTPSITQYIHTTTTHTHQHD